LNILLSPVAAVAGEEWAAVVVLVVIKLQAQL
jgi:hypothetical protein